MLKNVVVLYLTSQDCGVCQTFRGDGILGNGKEYMEFDKLYNLLYDGVTFLNIHSRIRDGKLSSITDISKFWFYVPTKEERKNGMNEKIIQEKCFKFEDKVRVLVLEQECENPLKEPPYETKKPKAIETYTLTKNDSDQFVNWDEWITSQIPKKLENFTGIYVPQVIVAKKNDWIKSLKDGSSFHAMADRSKIVKNGNEWSISQDRRLAHQFATEIGTMMQELRKGTFKFEAIEENSTPPDFEKSEKVGKVEVKKEVISSPSKYIYYDDPE